MPYDFVNVEPRFSIASLEPAILSRTALDDGQTPFHYLLGAWKRTVETSRSIRPDRDKQAGENKRFSQKSEDFVSVMLDYHL